MGDPVTGRETLRCAVCGRKVRVSAVTRRLITHRDQAFHVCPNSGSETPRQINDDRPTNRLRCVDEWRYNRNYIRPGDTVSITEPRKQAREYRVGRLFADDTGVVREIECFGDRGARQFFTDRVRVRRVAMTRVRARGDR